MEAPGAREQLSSLTCCSCLERPGGSWARSPWAGKGGAEGGSLLQALTQPGLPQTSQLFGAAKADGAVAAAVPVLSPLPAETGPGATNQKSKLKMLKLSTLVPVLWFHHT